MRKECQAPRTFVGVSILNDALDIADNLRNVLCHPKIGVWRQHLWIYEADIDVSTRLAVVESSLAYVQLLHVSNEISFKAFS